MNNINIYTSDWKATGNHISVPQYSMTIRAEWTDKDGESHTKTKTFNFPNVLANIPPKHLSDVIKNIITD